ncbi:gamma-glutamyltransferase [candidate division MSBL1 archaeon SCGC-AAA259J03]|uniref:Gamma-glutamyltransferase n=1 Tax=candidate division MSBL1 archaeon SCGC-AAA259J03 TaxID=1698269 RepID=A0A656YWW0_9EURY|nr:gamma-glutamyltransferase [candidate division MSBL1 archaeon SCGC-AAA259J03]
MKFDPLEYPYPSRRSVIYAKKGMVATSQPLASQTGIEILKRGGNAIDAAIGTAASLTVLEPNNNGIGGDAFAMIWNGEKLYGLNSSGSSPSSISIEKLKNKGYEEMPLYGWEPVTIPGVPGGWAELSEKFGKLSFSETLKPAIKYAKEGYPVSPKVGKAWGKFYNTYKQLQGEEFKYWFNTFTTENNKPPKIGSLWKSEDHAETLQKIAKSKVKSFYKGKIADEIDEFSKKYGGYISKKDLEKFSPKWVDPIKVNYRNYEVWEIPPNSQGLIVLLALNILKGFNFDAKEQADTYHKQIEALKLAFADGQKFITDPEYMNVNIDTLLSEDYSEKRREKIKEKAIKAEAGNPSTGDTVYLATADRQGNMVSYIQSNYEGFGSGLVVPNTGIALQNRGALFSLDPQNTNCLTPEKKTYHTIIPGFVTKEGKPGGPFGVMGGFMQPQGHLQVITNTIDFGLNPQATLDAPRWRWANRRTVKLEHGVPLSISKNLSRKNHNIEYSIKTEKFGKGQIIWKINDVIAGGTEPRSDGTIAAW